MKNKNFVFRVVMIFVSLALTGIDQLTKWLAVEFIKPEGTIPIIKFGETEWVNFTYCENTGMSFSLLEGQRFILIAVPIILIILVEWYIFSGKAEKNVLDDICIDIKSGETIGIIGGTGSSKSTFVNEMQLPNAYSSIAMTEDGIVISSK